MFRKHLAHLSRAAGESFPLPPLAKRLALYYLEKTRFRLTLRVIF